MSENLEPGQDKARSRTCGALFCLVLSREWGEWIFGTIIGDCLGTTITTIGIRSPIPN